MFLAPNNHCWREEKANLESKWTSGHIIKCNNFFQSFPFEFQEYVVVHLYYSVFFLFYTVETYSPKTGGILCVSTAYGPCTDFIEIQFIILNNGYGKSKIEVLITWS